MTIISIQSTERASVIVPPAATQSAPAFNAAPEQTATGYYFSPVLKIDPQTQSVVIQFRNAETGAVINQYPSEKELKAYASQEKLSNAAPASLNTIVSAAAQPIASAVIDASAIKPIATSTSTTALDTEAEPAASPESGSSIII